MTERVIIPIEKKKKEREKEAFHLSIKRGKKKE